MKRFFPFFVVTVVAILVGFVVGWIFAGRVNETRLERVVAMSWGGGKYGTAFYGAHVYLEPQAGGYSVRARVLIGRGRDYFHDCGELGRVRTDSEAVAKWGTIEWREDGLRIGSGPDTYFLPRAKLERHR